MDLEKESIPRAPFGRQSCRRSSGPRHKVRPRPNDNPGGDQDQETPSTEVDSLDQSRAHQRQRSTQRPSDCGCDSINLSYQRKKCVFLPEVSPNTSGDCSEPAYLRRMHDFACRPEVPFEIGRTQRRNRQIRPCRYPVCSDLVSEPDAVKIVEQASLTSG